MFHVFLILSDGRQKWLATVRAASLVDALEHGVSYGVDRMVSRDRGVTGDGDVLYAERAR